MIVFSVISIVYCIIIKTVLKWDNKKLKREAKVEGKVVNLFTL